MLVQTYLYLILSFVFSTNKAHATSCQVYPSEYAYLDASVTKTESTSAKCRSYPPGNLPGGLHPEHYFHCDGIQLKLTDFNFGQEQYQSSDYYMWSAGSDGKLLFIFPTRVSLTTITLHYYSDSDRGRPRLRFYAVPDNFDIWDALTTGTPYVGIASVPPGGEPAGRTSARLLHANFNITKLLMYKFSSSFAFAISEVEFSTVTMSCKEPTTDPRTDFSSLSAQTDNSITEKHTTSYFPTTNSTSIYSLRVITSSALDSTISVVQSNGNIIIIGISITILLILSTILIITATVLIWRYKRRSSKQVNNSSPYSTLNRRAGQPQSLQQDMPELYDQIHLSPSTGQAEYIPKSETANINNPSQISQNSHPTYSTAGGDTAEYFSTLKTAKATTSPLSLHRAHESTSEQPTYAAVDTSKKKKLELKENVKCKAAEKGPPVLPYSGTSMQEKKENATKQEITSPHTIEQLYTAVKKPKDCEPKGEEETPPIPPLYTVEELYTAVQKKPKSISNADSNKDEAPPPHTVKETQTAAEKPSQSATEDLYTAVMKQPIDASEVDMQTAPPIPPHTVEELYTAVMKKPNSGAENEEEAPPIPPYITTL